VGCIMFTISPTLISLSLLPERKARRLRSSTPLTSLPPYVIASPLPHSYTKTPGCHPARNSHFGTCPKTAPLLRAKRSHATASLTCALLHRQMFLSLLGFRFCAVQAGVLSQIVQPLHSSRLAEASREPQETPYCLKKTHGDVPNGRSCGWTRENCFPHLHGRAPELPRKDQHSTRCGFLLSIECFHPVERG